MIQKLRYKFIAIAMASMFLVLFVIGLGAALVTYRQVVEDADDLVAVLAENNGSFKGLGDELMGPPPEGDPSENGEPPEDLMMYEPMNKGDQGRLKDELSVETPYETRFFSVILDENGERKSVDTGKIAAVSSSDAVTYATQVYGAYKAASGEKKGFLGDYRFGIYEKSDGYLVIFVDCGRTLSAFYRFVRNTIIIAVLGMLAVWVLLSFASGRIVKPIAESYEKQKGFITDAGHELKTPLAIINADADVLAMDVGDGNEWVSDIKLQAKRLSELTADLIALSRLEENNESIPHTELDFSALVKEITDSFAGPAISRKLKLSSEIAENCKVSGNEKALTRLLSVLLDNAMKYTVVDGDVKVTLVKKSSRQLRLSVNNAIAEPLEKEQLERMFDRFYRTDASRNSEMGGHGIGLSIAAAIVKNHKGTITALCPSEHELSIKITLPII